MNRHTPAHCGASTAQARAPTFRVSSKLRPALLISAVPYATKVLFIHSRRTVHVSNMKHKHKHELRWHGTACKIHEHILWIPQVPASPDAVHTHLQKGHDGGVRDCLRK